MNDKPIYPEMRSMPLVEKLQLPDRAATLPKIDSGEIDHLDFRARVFQLGENRNSFKFRPEDLPALAASFEGQPFLRNHDTADIGARDGTILSSIVSDGAIVQDIRLTTRRGMTDLLEGKIDRFSIGFWDYKDIQCSVCNDSYLSAKCRHYPGHQYDTTSGPVKCEMTFIEPKGKETSAVNTPAVSGTGIESTLEFKLEVLGAEIERLKSTAQAPDERQEPPAPVDETPQAQARPERESRRLALASRIIFVGGNQPMNIRELLKKRAGLIEQAAALHTLAETENRDLSADERAQFGGLMDEADALEAQIKTIQAERARLEAAQASLAQPAGEAEKPAPGNTVKSMKRAQFDALNQYDRAAMIRSGVKVED